MWWCLMILRICIRESAEELEKLIKSSKSGDVKDKLKLLRMIKLDEIKEIQEASKKLYRNRNTITRWLKKYRSGGLKKLVAANKKPVGRTPKYLTIKELDLLRNKLKDPSGFSSFLEIQFWIKEELKKDIPYAVVWHTVRIKLKSKLKVPRPVNIKKDKEKEELFKKTSLIN